MDKIFRRSCALCIQWFPRGSTRKGVVDNCLCTLETITQRENKRGMTAASSTYVALTVAYFTITYVCILHCLYACCAIELGIMVSVPVRVRPSVAMILTGVDEGFSLSPSTS